MTAPDDSTPRPDPTSEERRRAHAERMKTARASAIGLQFAISIAIGAFGGNWLDSKFGTAPWLLLSGIVLGAAAAFRDLARIARDQSEED